MRPEGVGLHKKPKDLSVSEREVCEQGEGVGVNDTLLQSDTVHPYGRAKADMSPLGVELRKKLKDLSVSEREVREQGEGVGVYSTLL